MITKEQLLEGMRRADAAGNSDDVRRLGELYKSGRYFSEKDSYKYLKSAGQNLDTSAGKVAEDIANVALHPIDTTQGLLNIANGALQHVLPESISQYMPESTRGNKELASSVGQQYKDRFGSVQGYNESFADDPVSTLLDTSMVAGLPALALKSVSGAARLANAPKSAKAFSDKAIRASELADTLNPISAFLQGTEVVSRPVRKTLTKLSGGITGLGSDLLNRTTDAAAKGHVPGNIEDLAPRVEAALDSMRIEGQLKYTRDIAPISKDSTVLSLAAVDEAVRGAIRKANVTLSSGRPYVKSPNAPTMLNAIRKEYGDFLVKTRGRPTAMDLDAFKQRIHNTLVEPSEHGTLERKMVGGVHDAIKKTIIDQAPDYAKVMRDYHTNMDDLHNISKATGMTPNNSLGAVASNLFTLAKSVGDSSGRSGAKVRLAEKLTKYDPTLVSDLALHADPSTFSRASLPTFGFVSLLSNPISGLASTALTSPMLSAKVARAVGEAKRFSSRGGGAKPAIALAKVGSVDRKKRKFKLTLGE
jgi:hypothetical protein